MANENKPYFSSGLLQLSSLTSVFIFSALWRVFCSYFMQQQFIVGMNIRQHIASSLFFFLELELYKSYLFFFFLTCACYFPLHWWDLHEDEEERVFQRPAHLIVNTNGLLPLLMTRNLGKCCTSLCNFLAWSHTFICLNYKRCENSAGLFSIKNHLAFKQDE